MTPQQSPARQLLQSPARQRDRWGPPRFRVFLAEKMPYGLGAFNYSGPGPWTCMNNQGFVGGGAIPGLPFQGPASQAFQRYDYLGTWNGNIHTQLYQVVNQLSGEVAETRVIRNPANDPGPRYGGDVFTEPVKTTTQNVQVRTDIFGNIERNEYNLSLPWGWTDVLALFEVMFAAARLETPPRWQDLTLSPASVSTNASTIPALKITYSTFDFNVPDPGGQLVFTPITTGSNAALLNAELIGSPAILTGAVVKQIVDFENVPLLTGLHYGSTSRQIPLPAPYNGIVRPVLGATLRPGSSFVFETELYPGLKPGFRSWQCSVTCPFQTIFAPSWVQCAS